jgi:HD superfamily phosphohydrolase
MIVDLNKEWIFQIVANKEVAIDVDRFDYIQRDSFHIGLTDTNVDYRNLIKEVRVIGDYICYPAKVSIYIHFILRAQQAYQSCFILATSYSKIYIPIDQLWLLSL